ncbi:unnamed protein product [Cyprideis torosa]|uniref:Uncharacterized protein n=1 Tax=Cyprideis torosa TaxID=163714 RepID=A0A7R8W7Q0_9CRUS|nr:unnamed protein product [Cyprideis torosa]CAG0883459.1 unnamed protein product [Cyprideis torosa]
MDLTENHVITSPLPDTNVSTPIPVLCNRSLVENMTDESSTFCSYEHPSFGEVVSRPPGSVLVPIYSLIFLLSVAGNGLVILTLVRDIRMRTVTNIFLLNLAASDLLIGVACMPFTLVGTLLKDFIFGEAACKMISYFQGVSVSVSAWTLVVISLERYVAIVYPLRGRRWQTRSHAYNMIAITWLVSAVVMTPIAVLTKHIPLTGGRHKCREEWPDPISKYAFNLFLDVFLLVIPLLVMAASYTLISHTLWNSIRDESLSQHTNNYEHASISEGGSAASASPSMRTSRSFTGNGTVGSHDKNSSSGHLQAPTDVTHLLPPSPHHRRFISSSVRVPHRLGSNRESSPPTPLISKKPQGTSSARSSPSPSIRRQKDVFRYPLRRSNQEKALQNKKRIIQMLAVVVISFFVCWTPLYVIHTVALFDAPAVYGVLGSSGFLAFYSFAYVSCCVNPIVYCFMHSSFRKAFLNVFGRCCPREEAHNHRQFSRRELTQSSPRHSPLSVHLATRVVHSCTPNLEGCKSSPDFL